MLYDGKQWNTFNRDEIVDDIFDEAVIEKNNWLMYGSSKPNKEPYKITNFLKFENDELKKIKENKKIG